MTDGMSSILHDFDEKLVTAPVRFAGRSFMVLSSGALYWPERRTLILGDLHFGKAERVARRGGALLPPFGDLDTLARLDATLFFTKPACVISLGDAFDDDEAGRALPRSVKSRLAAIAKVTDWIWITGNHDPGHHDLPGDIMPELRFGNLAFRHQAGLPNTRGPDISGHFHPKTRIAGRTTRALLVGEEHMILPAFGTFTGGLEMDHPELTRLTGGGIAYAMGRKILRVPIPAPQSPLSQPPAGPSPETPPTGEGISDPAEGQTTLAPPSAPDTAEAPAVEATPITSPAQAAEAAGHPTAEKPNADQPTADGPAPEKPSSGKPTSGKLTLTRNIRPKARPAPES